ncbi:MAG: response regulator [Campylobacterales bacterium]|nr:response regulator [Campylobacterales bacterium]
MPQALHVKPVILIIDDMPDMLMMLTHLLQSDYTIKAAASGIQALDYLSERPVIDLILLDVLMPDLDGFEVCRRIKAQEALAHIPLIFITVLESEHDIVKGFEVGAVDYVAKPFEPEVLKARIKTHIELKGLRDALASELAHKEELLVTQSKMASLGEIFEHIAHQWKQPLSIISLSCHNIRLGRALGSLDEAEERDALDAIDSAVTHLSRTVDDFRDFIQETPKPETVALEEMVRRTLKLFELKFIHHDIDVQLEALPIELSTRKNDLIQVLMNIFANAVDVLMQRPKERRIRIQMSQNAHIITLRICDNGRGIDPAVLGRIFDKYVSTKKTKGSGLGLYMSHQIVTKRLGGTLRAYNDDEGACFELTLPIALHVSP